MFGLFFRVDASTSVDCYRSISTFGCFVTMLRCSVDLLPFDVDVWCCFVTMFRCSVNCYRTISMTFGLLLRAVFNFGDNVGQCYFGGLLLCSVDFLFFLSFTETLMCFWWLFV
jgi:hypothetical protein